MFWLTHTHTHQHVHSSILGSVPKHTHTETYLRQENHATPPPAPPPASGSPTVKYLNSADLYTETLNGRRDSKTSNSSSTKNDYYYDKENELYSQRRAVTKPKLTPPREERELTSTTNTSSSSSFQQRHQQLATSTLTRSLSPIPSPTLNVTKFLLFRFAYPKKKFIQRLTLACFV